MDSMGELYTLDCIVLYSVDYNVCLYRVDLYFYGEDCHSVDCTTWIVSLGVASLSQKERVWETSIRPW